MKRITLFFVAVLLVAVTALAIGQQKGFKLQGIGLQKSLVEKKAPKKASLQRQSDLSKRVEARKFLARAKGERVAKARKAVGDLLIENQPKGELVSYVRSGEANYPFWGYIFSTTVVGAANDVVFSTNGKTVYIKNLLTQYNCGTWTKGTIDGNSIKIEFPQPAMKYSGEEYDLFLGAYDEDELEFIAQESATLTLDYDPETGDITTPEGSDFATGALQIGLCDSDGGWAGYTDWNITLKKQTDEPIAAPEGLETAQYSITADGYAGSLVQVGIDGNDIYVQGIKADIPDTWIKGTISGDKATFKSGQYLGSDGNYHQYLVAATAEEVWDDYYEEYFTEYALSDGDIVFDYDAATKTLSNSSTFLINAGTDDVNYAAAFDKAKIAPFTEVAATPAAPTVTSYTPYDYSNYINGYGWGYVEFTLNTSDVDGNYILPEKMSYKLYTRTEGYVQEIEITPDTYVEIDEAMDEIPYGFTENWDLYAEGNNHSVYIYVTGFDEIGVKTIYRGAGETRESEIDWYSVDREPQPEKETPDYPEVDPANTGSSINYSLWDGKSDIDTFGEPLAETYDVAMKLQREDLVGTHIDKISFTLLNTEGISDMKVWLSSNLRVEDNKNVPNLVEVPVENAEAGTIEVALDKPYTIPAEGVYVGYSFTVDDTSIEANETPVVVIRGSKEGGFYIHNTKTYRSWMDLSAEVGISAYIGVEISGSAIKDDAASPLANATTYVKAGEAINVTSTIVNHGANGIQSLDVDYTLNGATTSKHFDLENAIDGTFGLAATVANELPAIAERGNYDLVVKVTKVNGKANEDAAAESTTPLVVLNSVPKHRPVLEEYTGTWCGYCPRGYVGLQMLAEQYPDDYVLISYHNADDMEIMSTSEFPSAIPGYPDAWIDRTIEVDAYYGYDEDYGVVPLGVVKPLNERAAEFGQADIEVAAMLNSDNSAVNVKATVTFPYDIDENKFALEYVLVADGLSDESWGQSNYYSGDTEVDDNFKVFVEGESTVYGLVYNDVAVKVSAPYGLAIDGSLPASMKADEAIAHKYVFNLDEVLNTSDQPIIQDIKKLRVVAILVNTETGEVVNANKADVAEYDPAGISVVTNSLKGLEAERYNAAGQRIAAPQKGLNIIKLSNGKSIKVIVK